MSNIAATLRLTGAALASAVAFGQAAEVDCRGELARFAETLRAVRSGDAERAAELSDIAALLCDRCARCDAADAAAFYAELDAGALARGLEAETRFTALRDEVIDAGRADRAIAEPELAVEWATQRARILRDLAALGAEVEREPDHVPAARAYALAARIETEQLESDPELAPQAARELAERARANAARAEALFRRAGLLTPQLEPRWIAARLAWLAGDPVAARSGFESCLALAERVANDDFREHALRGLLSLARDNGDVRAEERLLEALATFRDPRESWPLARDWAMRLVSEDRAEAALAFLDRCEPPADAHVLDRMEWELVTGGAWLRIGDTERAREHLEAAASGPRSELALLALASLALEESRAFETLDLLGSEPRLAELSANGEQRARALLGEAWLETGDPKRATAELERALDLARRAETSGSRIPIPVEAWAGSVIGERLGLHAVALLADGYSRLGEFHRAALAIEDAQARSMRRGTRERLTAADLDHWAAHFELGILTWVVGPDFSVVAHVASDGAAWSARLPRGRREIAEGVRRLRESAIGGDGARTATLGRELRNELVPEELARRLRERAVSCATGEPRLLVAAHGPLEALPFELCSLSETAGRDDLAIVCLPGLVAARPGAPPGSIADSGWILAGDPRDAEGESLLPGAHGEIAALRELWPDARTIEGDAFRAEALLDALRERRSLHVATHVRTDCDPGALRLGAAGLECSGGECAGGEAIAARSPELPLAVLSACETGAGPFVDAEGLLGLARAFLEGGTRNVLVTRWPVEDSAAAAFALAFHRALAAGGTPSRAARSARGELRQAGYSPADWAAFALLGRD